MENRKETDNKNFILITLHQASWVFFFYLGEVTAAARSVLPSSASVTEYCLLISVHYGFCADCFCQGSH